MSCDISVVLFRPESDDIAPTLRSIAAIRNEFRVVRFLISGTRAEFEAVDALISRFGLRDQSVIIHRFDNLGFASGHNMLLATAFADAATSVLVLNPDTNVLPGSLTRLMNYVEMDGGRALYGPSLRQIHPDRSLHSETSSVDTLGIEWTMSGRHQDKGQGAPWNVTDGRLKDVMGVSGAALLVTRWAYERTVSRSSWFFDDLFLAYREDAELGIRAQKAGVPSRVIEVEGFDHVRSVRGFTRGKELPDLLGVRNRFLMLFRLRLARPGNPIVSIARDVMVLAAAATVERSSWPGVRSAFAIRRYVSNSRMR